MKFVLIALAALAIGGSRASAADLPAAIVHAPTVAPASGWSGFYLGANAGYGFGHLATTNNSMTTSGPLVGIPLGTFTPASTFAGADSSSNLDGATAGGFIGYNYQIGNIVLGVETDFQWSDFKTSSAFSGSALGPQYTTAVKGDMFGTTRGRIGYAVNDLLVYATGGVAYGHFNSDLGILPGPAGAPTGPQYLVRNSSWLTGYAVGAGVDYKLTRNVIIGVEYLRIGYGNSGHDYGFGAAGSAHADAKMDFDLVRARLGYKF